MKPSLPNTVFDQVVADRRAVSPGLLPSVEAKKHRHIFPANQPSPPSTCTAVPARYPAD